MDNNAVYQELIDNFKMSENLSERQISQFVAYASLLKEKNELVNLTALVENQDIFQYHFQDSLILDKYENFSLIQSIVDVGSGGGFPGIPLKIKYPHLYVRLIEVNKKKIQFLYSVIELLSLENIEVIDLDWRTFTRRTSYHVDLFLSRASLTPNELLRIYRQGCSYNKARLVYFASNNWKINSYELPFFEKEITYTIGLKTRKFIFFQKR